MSLQRKFFAKSVDKFTAKKSHCKGRQIILQWNNHLCNTAFTLSDSSVISIFLLIVSSVVLLPIWTDFSTISVSILRVWHRYSWLFSDKKSDKHLRVFCDKSDKHLYSNWEVGGNEGFLGRKGIFPIYSWGAKQENISKRNNIWVEEQGDLSTPEVAATTFLLFWWCNCTPHTQFSLMQTTIAIESSFLTHSISMHFLIVSIELPVTNSWNIFHGYSILKSTLMLRDVITEADDFMCLSHMKEHLSKFFKA